VRQRKGKKKANTKSTYIDLIDVLHKISGEKECKENPMKKQILTVGK
jgi:hypothetical protein